MLFLGGWDVGLEFGQLRRRAIGRLSDGAIRPFRRGALNTGQFAQTIEGVGAPGEILYTFGGDTGGRVGTTSFGVSPISRRSGDAVRHAIGQGVMAIVSEVLEVIAPVFGETCLDVGTVGIREDATYCLVVRLARQAIEGGIGAVGDEGERWLGGHGWHLRI